MQIKIINAAEYQSVAKIHLSAFPNFFLTTLGLKFLETYYKASLKSNETVAVGAYNEVDKIIGFSIGCQHSLGYHKRLVKKNFLSFLFRGIILIATKPTAILRLAKNFDKNANPSDDGNYAELLSIGVSSDLKGSGIGKELIHYFEDELKKRNCKRVSLTTDETDNETVVFFYKKNGYEVIYEFTTYPNRKMYKMIKNL